MFYMAVDYFGISAKIVRQVCFQDLSRHTFLWYLEGVVLGHVYSDRLRYLCGSGECDEAERSEMK